jgi:chromosome segregation ATPase
MTLGPNGTGKSTIACALCIGLGFPVVVRSLSAVGSLNVTLIME